MLFVSYLRDSEQTILEADLRKELELANPRHSPTEIVLVGAAAGSGKGSAYAFVEYHDELQTPNGDGGDPKGCAEIAAETIVSVSLMSLPPQPPLVLGISHVLILSKPLRSPFALV